MLWVLIGWQFTLAEYVGGIVMIVLMTVMLRLFVSPQPEEIARRHAQEADTGHQHHMAASEELTWRQRLTRADAWSDVAHNFRGEWQMLYKDVNRIVARHAGLPGCRAAGLPGCRAAGLPGCRAARGSPLRACAAPYVLHPPGRARHPG
ncbi:MAG: hypothetical protein ACR2NR_17170 [Solirubrobacteraceae bacterium]